MIFVLVTCPTEEEATVIARDLIGRRLAACAHITPPHKSIYWWKDKVEEAQEVNILIKTCAELFEDVRKAVVALHPYEVPCIVSWEATQGHVPYLAWIESQATGQTGT